MEEIHCSKLPRVALCPGSYFAEQGITDESGEAAESGSRVHDALSKVITLKTMADRDVLAETIDKVCAKVCLKGKKGDRERFIVAWFAHKVFTVCEENGGAKHIKAEASVDAIISEKPAVSAVGTCDLFIDMMNKSCHLFEYKSGYLGVETSDKNEQAKGYAVGNCRRERITEVTVHMLVAGNVGEETHTRTTYGGQDLVDAETALTRICVSAVLPGAKRVPGEEQCKYCLASGTERCRETVVAVEQFHDHVKSMSKPEAVFGQLDPATRAQTVAMCKIVAAVSQKVLDCARVMLTEDANAIPGYTISEGARERKVLDPSHAYDLVAEVTAITPAQFASACSVKLGDLEQMFHACQVEAAKGAGGKPPTKKDAKEMLDSILDPVLERSRKAGSLVAIKK